MATVKDKNASGMSVSHMTEDKDYTLARKSTPITEGVCPFEAQLHTTHTVTAGVGTAFTCSCGAAWNWESPLHYEITAAGSE